LVVGAIEQALNGRASGSHRFLQNLLRGMYHGVAQMSSKTNGITTASRKEGKKQVENCMLKAEN
jgi:hypothetical protein